MAPAKLHVHKQSALSRPCHNTSAVIAVGVIIFCLARPDESPATTDHMSVDNHDTVPMAR